MSKEIKSFTDLMKSEGIKIDWSGFTKMAIMGVYYI